MKYFFYSVYVFLNSIVRKKKIWFHKHHIFAAKYSAPWTIILGYKGRTQTLLGLTKKIENLVL